MKKIRLNVDALTVESFSATTDGKARRGTVRGFLETFDIWCSAGCTGPTCQSCENCTAAGNTCSGDHVCFC